MLKITEEEKVFLLYFYSQWNKKFLKKPAVYALDMGVTENSYINCLKNLSSFGYIEEWIEYWNTDVKLTATWIAFCREIESQSRLNFLEKLVSHLEKRNNIYAIVISSLALAVSIIALLK